MRFLILILALVGASCAPLLPYEGPRQEKVYKPKIMYSSRYRQYVYVCKRGDRLVRYRGRTVCWDRF